MISRWTSDHTDMVGEEDGYFGVYVEGMSVDSSGEERGEGVLCRDGPRLYLCWNYDGSL